MGLAALSSVIWGLGFVAIKIGLGSFSAPPLTAVRRKTPAWIAWMTSAIPSSPRSFVLLNRSSLL